MNANDLDALLRVFSNNAIMRMTNGDLAGSPNAVSRERMNPLPERGQLLYRWGGNICESYRPTASRVDCDIRHLQKSHLDHVSPYLDVSDREQRKDVAAIDLGE